MHTDLPGKIVKGIKNPRRILPYLRLAARNRRLRAASSGHTDFYRRVMAGAVAQDPELAVGSDTHDHWLATGQLQFDYLVAHGLRPEHRILEIGCGNLRTGWRLIDYLDEGNYFGIDISPDVLIAAQGVLERFRLQSKLPHLTLVQDLRLSWLPDDSFDAIHAHSVFTHTPEEIVLECLANVGRVLKPDAFFDLTFFEAERYASSLQEDFFYPRAAILGMAESQGLVAEVMEDWDYPQSKVRVTLPDAEAAPAGPSSGP
ncbi:MAG: class I SAM-dependent methyltransferase [Gemmatimonadota bacterium]